MDKQELIQFLKDNLKIQIKIVSKPSIYGDRTFDKIQISIELAGEEIDSDYIGKEEIEHVITSDL